MDDRNRTWDALSFAGIISNFAVAFYGWMTLTGDVVTGIDSSGGARYAAKAQLFLLPVVSCAIFVLFKIIERAPTRMLNLPIRVTPENEAAVREWLSRFLASLRAVLIIGFVCMEAGTVQATLGNLNALQIVAAGQIAAVAITIGLQFRALFKLR